MKVLTLRGIIALASIVSVATIIRVAIASPAQTSVTIENYAFKAPSVTVTVGSTVVWKNLDDDPHTVTAVDGSFDSHGLAQGDTFSYRFDKPGKFEYYCKIHPMMRGTVIVTERNS